MPIKFEADDGYTEITIGDITKRLDLFEAHNRYAQLSDTHPDPIERATAWIAWLQLQGLPPISHGVAFQLASLIMDDVAAFKKKAGNIWGTADSAGSSDSPSSA